MANYTKRYQKEAEDMYRRAIEREGQKTGGAGFQQRKNAIKSARENYLNDYERQFGKQVRRNIVNSQTKEDMTEKKGKKLGNRLKLQQFLNNLSRK